MATMVMKKPRPYKEIHASTQGVNTLPNKLNRSDQTAQKTKIKKPEQVGLCKDTPN
jgi:hypothetical protein